MSKTVIYDSDDSPYSLDPEGIAAIAQTYIQTRDPIATLQELAVQLHHLDAPPPRPQVFGCLIQFFFAIISGKDFIRAIMELFQCLASGDPPPDSGYRPGERARC